MTTHSSISSFNQKHRIRDLSLVLVFLAFGPGLLSAFYLSNGETHRYLNETGMLQTRQLIKQKNQVSTLLLGDSMIAMSVYPPDITVFNFATPGDTIEDITEKFLFSADQLTNLDTIVLQIDPEMFTNRRLEQHAKQRYRNLSFSSLNCDVYGECQQAGLLENSRMIFIRYRMLVANVHRNEGIPEVQANGFSQMNTKNVWNLKKIQSIQDRIEVGLMQGVPAENLYSQFLNLEKMISQKGYRLVYFIPPIYPEYQKQRQAHLATWREHMHNDFIAERINKICNFSDHVQTATMFLNETHLTPDSAQKISGEIFACVLSH